MYSIPDHLEIALTVSSKIHGKQRFFHAFHDDFNTCHLALNRIASGSEPFSLPPDIGFPDEIVDATLSLDTVLPDGRIVPFALYHRTLNASELRNKFIWPEPYQDDLPERIVFFADFGGICVQDQEVQVIGDVQFFLDFTPSKKQLCALSEELNAWHLLYENGVSLDRKKNVTFDWEGFHAKGIAFCDKAQQVLGSRSQVFYRRITELEAPNDENSLVVFSVD
jgi:hypothetical protein